MFDTTKQRVIRVIGHKNPDTDSICSAISYAYLRNQISDQVHEPRRAGEISRETQFVLDHFGEKLPKLSVDMSPTSVRSREWMARCPREMPGSA